MHICSIPGGRKIAFRSLTYDMDDLVMLEGGILLNTSIGMCGDGQGHLHVGYHSILLAPRVIAVDGFQGKSNSPDQMDATTPDRSH